MRAALIKQGLVHSTSGDMAAGRESTDRGAVIGRFPSDKANPLRLRRREFHEVLAR